MNRHNEKEARSIRARAIGIVFCVWFFGSILAALLAKKAEATGWAVFCFGQIFFVIGIMAVRQEKKEGLRSPIVFIFPVVGFFMMACGLLWQSGDDEMKVQVILSVPFLLLGLFLLTGIILVLTFLIEVDRRSKCTVAVLGKCLEVKSKYTSSGNSMVELYCPVYEYAYDGRFYIGCQEAYITENCVEEGEYREIFINPDKPEIFYEEGRAHGAYGVLLCLGLFFIGVSLMGLSISYHTYFKM